MAARRCEPCEASVHKTQNLKAHTTTNNNPGREYTVTMISFCVTLQAGVVVATCLTKDQFSLAHSRHAHVGHNTLHATTMARTKI